MADMKLTADLDVRVNTDSIAADIARAIAGAKGHIAPNTAPIHAYDAAIAGLGERAGVAYLRGNAANAMGLPDVPGTLNSFARFASMAAASPYGYTPSTIQSMIRSSVTNVMKDYEVSPDLRYKLDMERITNKLRSQQRENRLSALAGVYATQGAALADAAAKASTPEAQKLLLGRAASRYGAISSRTFMESGAVSPETAAEALGISADLSTIRSGIKTTAQAEKEDEARKQRAIAATIAWKDKELAKSNAVFAAMARDAKDIARDNVGIWRAEVKSEQEAAATKAAQEDTAWGTIGYDESQKAKDMAKGFRTMEASSATEAAYNPNTDPAVARWNYGAGLHAAAQYASYASRFPAGSRKRDYYLNMATESMRGITVGAMAKSGMHEDELSRNSEALYGLTEQIAALRGEAPAGSGGGFWGHVNGDAISKVGTWLLGIAGTIMEGRTQWLEDTKTPYQTRRATQQQWAQKAGMGAAASGAAVGAAVGSIVPGIGTVAGAAVGGIGGVLVGGTSYLLGKHYEDERRIGDAQQSKTIDMLRWRNLYGPGVEYNYAQYAENTGYISATSMMGLNQAADMLPGAMMFGAVNEQQMMALSYMPNYWAALMEGRSTSEIASAYAHDIDNLPREMRQYITSLLPGASEDLRAYVQSESFRTGNALAREFGSYDATQYGLSSGWERGRQKIAAENVRHVQSNFVSETAVASAPNYYGNYDEWARAMVNTTGATAYTNADAVRAWRETAERLGLRGELGNGNTSNGMLGNIVINIDGNTIYNEAYTVDDFVKSNQTYVIGGV